MENNNIKKNIDKTKEDLLNKKDELIKKSKNNSNIEEKNKNKKSNNSSFKENNLIIILIIFAIVILFIAFVLQYILYSKRKKAKINTLINEKNNKKITKLNREKIKLINETEKLNEEINKLKKEKAELKKEKAQLSKEKNKLSKEKNKLRKEKNKLSQEKNQLLKKKEKLKKEKDKLEEEYDVLTKEYETLTEKKIPNPQDVYKQEKFSSRKKSFAKAKKFIENCIKGNLIQKIPSSPFSNPLISAIIPLYNTKNYCSKAIKSIQNQNIKNIEIILVDDKSKDETLSFIKKMQQEDPRIKIISNQKNMGTLYSRSIGALSAKGKYIFPLDSDDMFLDEDVFKTITNIAEKGNFDIVEFKGIASKKGNKGIFKNKISDTKWSRHPYNLVLYQPALGNYPVWPGKTLKTLHLETVYLWAKCIRTDIYQKTINKFGKEKYSRHVTRYEDILMSYALFNTARSYKFVGKYGIFYIYRPESVTKNKIKVETDIYNIYYLDIMIDFVQDRVENKKVLVNLILHLFDRKSFKKALKTSEDLYKLFISCLDKVLKMTKISNKLKDEIRKKGKTLKFIDYKF